MVTDPVAFTIGPLAVRWYGILIMLGVIAGAIGQLLDPLESELAVYAADSAVALARHDEQLQAGNERLERLRAGEATWRRVLQRRMQDLRMEMDFQSRRGAASVRARLQSALADPVKLECPQDVAASVEADLTLLGSELVRKAYLGM